MQTIVDIIPLKLGKVDAYKAFVAKIAGPRKKEYIELLIRYGLKSVNVYFHKINNVDFVVIAHTAEHDSRTRLTHFATSTHPMDQWFFKQLNDLYDFEILNGSTTSLQELFTLDGYYPK